MYPDTTNQFSPRQNEMTIDAAFACTNEIFAGIEKVAKLNVQTIKTSLLEQQALADAALSAQSVSEVLDLQSQQLPAAVTKTFAYWRHMEDIAAQTRNDLASAVQEHFGSSLQTFAKMFDFASIGLDAQDMLGKSSQFVMAQSADASAERVAIVDSSGKVLSSEGVRSDLH
ncbi:phasin family protein [Burkholderia sp. Ch1-1]|uniref:Phasin family protein n=2 Tax=Burkholderiaceae TaxID=119060 RepID=A0A5Q4Z3T9_9BURK|nr:phasin family protein [Burkholderia sp. Ch1-1]VVD34416.1 Phasin family protein [Paraburkholderia dioscoreae]